MMRFLLFDVKPAQTAVQRYLDVAAALRPRLDALGGCLFIDRFRDLDDARWLLSFQFWRDEEAIAAWRQDGQHHGAQRLGRDEVFEDYRIRVGAIVDSPAPENGRYVVLADSRRAEPRGEPVAGLRRFASIYREGEFMHVAGATTLAGARSIEASLAQAFSASQTRIGLVERDYSLRERAEAPQQFPAR